LTLAELRDAAVNEWERYQERLRRGVPSYDIMAKPVADTRAYPLQTDAADNEQYHTDKTRPADLSITALAAAITKVLSGAVAPVVIQAATGLGTDSDGIGGIDDG